MKKLVLLFVLLLTFCMCKPPQEKETILVKESTDKKESTNKVVLSSEINWDQLNPARGDRSPKAGAIWGNRKDTVPTGFLVEFIDGFSSPPHIHNVTYRALVIKGLIHNDDENAEKMWMPSGSFWTQPAGASHITAAKGEDNLIYLEIDHGPYLVKPTEEAFNNGESPINVDASNIVWLDANKSNKVEKGAEISYLWKQNNLEGSLIKLPKGYKGIIKSNGSVFHAIVIQGQPIYNIPNDANSKTLDPGSYFTSNGTSSHFIVSDKTQETLIYIRTNGDLSIKAQ